MARLIPKINPSEIENPGERKLAQALVSQLGSDVEIYHSFRWLSERDRGQVLDEGEADFVLLDPDNGLLFIEVKGGDLRFNSSDMAFERVGSNGSIKVLKESPFDQVAKSVHELVKRVQAEHPAALVARRGGRTVVERDVPFTYGFAVAFPDCRYQGRLPPGTHPDLLLDADKCQELGSSLKRVFERFRRTAHPRLSGVDIDAVHAALFPTFNIMPVLWRKIEDQEERLRRMTEDQRQVLDVLSEHKKAAIRGVAGSGKTVLALAKAQEMARSGSRTLLLCYNALLKDWLQNAIPDELQGILKIDNYHGVASDMCKMAGVYFGPGFGKQVDQEFWNNIAPEKLMEACRLLDADKKFDAVVVDEGQDFQDLWWISLEGLFRNYKDPDCFYVFYDPKQNIFVEQLSLPPGLGTAYPLKTNCRNTEKIATHCAGLVDEPSKVRAGAPVGEEPVFATAPNMRDAFSQAGSIVRSWCTGAQSGLRPSQVAVLAAGSSVKYWPHKFDALNVTQDLEKWRKDEGVLLASWSRFKGLEADAVVLIESADGDGIRDQANRYVARSRAKHLLHVIQVK